MRTPPTLILFTKNKLFHLENMLPLANLLVSSGRAVRPVVVCATKSDAATIRSNTVLSEHILKLGGRVVHLGGRESTVRRYLSTLLALRRLLFGRCVMLGVVLQQGRLVRMMTDLNRRIFGGRNLLFLGTNLPPTKQRRMDRFAELTTGHDRRARTGERREETKLVLATRIDGLVANDISALPEAFPRHRIDPSLPLIEVGDTRRIASWQAFLAAQSERLRVDDIRQPYFVLYLSTLDTPNVDRDNAYDNRLIIDCLLTLKPYNDRILTVFKPHPATDMTRFSELLRETGYRNYVISYLHPAVLATRANFAMAYYGSTALIDAYNVGCPTLDYAEYDSRGREVLQGHSLIAGWVDHFCARSDDRAKIHALLDRLSAGWRETPLRRDRQGAGYAIIDEARLVASFDTLLGNLPATGETTPTAGGPRLTDA